MAIEKIVEELKEELDNSKRIENAMVNFTETVVDSNEELMATFVEGTKRLLKKDQVDPTPVIKDLKKSIDEQTKRLSIKINDVERATRGVKGFDDSKLILEARTSKNVLKKLNEKVGNLNLSLPTDPKNPVAVRLSDGEEFYKAADQLAAAVRGIQVGGGNGSGSFEDTRGVVRKAVTDTDGHLQVDVLSGGGGGTLVADGDAVSASNTGQLILGTDGSNYQVASTDTDGHLQVDVLSGGGGGTQYTEGDTDASITGTAIMWEDAANTLRSVSSSKPLPVDLGANNDVTLATLPDTAAGDLAAINTSTDGIEALLTTIDADTSNIATNSSTTAAGFATEGSALGSGVLLQGDDGTDRKNINVDATTGDVQVDVTNTVTVDGSGVTQPVSGTVTANLGATDNAVLDSIDTSVTSKYITGNADGVTTVTTAGTDVALAGSTTCKRVVIQAQTDNTGLIAVGATGVDATEATGTGIILYPGDAYELEIDNLNEIYIDSTVNGEGVRYHYFT